MTRLLLALAVVVGSVVPVEAGCGCGCNDAPQGKARGPLRARKVKVVAVVPVVPVQTVAFSAPVYVAPVVSAAPVAAPCSACGTRR